MGAASNLRDRLPVFPASQVVAALSRTLSDPRRVEILSLLRRGPATTTEISETLGLRIAETSVHLAKLRAVEWVHVARQGRHRVYSVDPDIVSRALDLLVGISRDVRTSRVSLPDADIRSSRPLPTIRTARACYDHLAGEAGVWLADRLVLKGWALRAASGFVLTRDGEEAVADRGIDLEVLHQARRKFAPGCLDWTERRFHIGGSFGAELFQSLLRSGYLKRGFGRRVVLQRPLERWFRPMGR